MRSLSAPHMLILRFYTAYVQVIVVCENCQGFYRGGDDDAEHKHVKQTVASRS